MSIIKCMQNWSRCVTMNSMTDHTGSIKVTLDASFPSADWEKIEDIIAEALATAGYAGSITNSVTLNSTSIERKNYK